MRTSTDNQQAGCRHTHGFELATLYPGDINPKYVCKEGCGAVADNLTRCPPKRAYGYLPASNRTQKTPQSCNIQHKHLVTWGQQNARKMGRPKKVKKKSTRSF